MPGSVWPRSPAVPAGVAHPDHARAFGFGKVAHQIRTPVAEADDSDANHKRSAAAVSACARCFRPAYIADHSRGISRDDRIIRHVARDHGSGADDRARAHRYAA